MNTFKKKDFRKLMKTIKFYYKRKIYKFSRKQKKMNLKLSIVKNNMMNFARKIPISNSKMIKTKSLLVF